MSSPQNPDDDAATSGPLDGPTTQYRVPTPPGAPPSTAPTSPPPPSAPTPGPSAQTTQYLRPPTPSPTAAPTRVHTRTSPPSGPPPQTPGQAGYPPPGQRSRQAPPPVQSIPTATPRHQAPDAGGPGQAPTMGQQGGQAPAGYGPPPQAAPFTPPGAPSGSVPGAPAPFGPPPGQVNPAAAQSQSAPSPAMTGSSALGQPGTAPVADGQQMKRRNTIAVWLGLPIITLGIYTFVWYYKIHKEMAAFDRRKEIPVASPMLVILFLGWTVIAPIISFNNAGKRIRDAQRSAGLAETCNPLLCWLLMFAFGLHTWYMQSELNKVIDRYGAEPGTTVPLFA